MAAYWVSKTVASLPVGLRLMMNNARQGLFCTSLRTAQRVQQSGCSCTTPTRGWSLNVKNGKCYHALRASAAVLLQKAWKVRCLMATRQALAEYG